MKTQTNTRRIITALALTLLAGSALAAPPGVRYVRADAPDGGDGQSWATAYNDLRLTLITAGSSGGAITELWVKEGSYSPNMPGGTDRTRSFTLVPDVGVYGGFVGTETSRDQRDPAAHITTLDGQQGGTAVNNVVIGAGNAQTTLDGFTITHGAAPLSTMSGPGWAGAGIHITGSPAIRNCIIRGNSLAPLPTFTALFKKGAGVYCAPGSAPVLTDCALESNHTNSATYAFTLFDFGSAGAGGALAADDAALTMIRCSIRNNNTGDGGYIGCSGGSPAGGANGGPGGGLALFSSAALIQDCTFTGNITGTATKPPGCGTGGSVTREGRDAGNGGGIYATGSTLVVLNCTFVANRAAQGGPGGDAGGSPTGARGGKGGSGGAIWATGGPIEIVNCSFARNTSGLGGPGGSSSGGPGPSGTPGTGAGAFGDLNTHLDNCIVWNQATSEIGGSASAAYSDVFSGFAGVGNIDADPRFVDAVSGDYRLLPTSPCIDAGNSAVNTDPSTPGTQPLPPTDLAGLPRRVDIAAVPDTGVGPPVVDMGAYEVQAPCAADLNGDGLIDFADYLEFLNLFDAMDPRADFNHDGFIDFADYLEFLNHFDAGC